MRKNIYAHTETGAQHPGYISINLEENNAYSIAVRNRGGNVSASIEMNRAQLEGLARSIFAHLGVVITPAQIKSKGK